MAARLVGSAFAPVHYWREIAPCAFKKIKMTDRRTIALIVEIVENKWKRFEVFVEVLAIPETFVFVF
jgi:hypothetical protein